MTIFVDRSDECPIPVAATTNPARGHHAHTVLFVLLVTTCLQAVSNVAGKELLEGKASRPLTLDEYMPTSQLFVPQHHPQHAKFPAVDVHTHCRYKLKQVQEELDEFVRLMDHEWIAVCVSLDGRLGDELEQHKRFLWKHHHDRFVIFANIDWQGSGERQDPATWDCLRPDFGHRMAAALAQAKDQGASGLKVFKQLGLGYRDAEGKLLRVDDPRWDPIWRACGELGFPVLIHTADPVAFFEPADRFNERWEELQRHPDWNFSGDDFPSHEGLLQQLLHVVERHPETTFIAAHMSNIPENLEQLGKWLDEHPNLYVDLAARLAELGRQPFTARKFFIRYADRILFGTDGPRPASRLHPHWRMLETQDEYFPYAEDQYPPQGFWRIYGLDLPDDVLRKVYAENAARLIPGVKDRLEWWTNSQGATRQSDGQK